MSLAIIDKIINEIKKSKFIFLFGSLIIFLLMLYQYELLTYLEWGDESETIVTVKMMAAGERLYSKIFNHHGPATFMPGLALHALGDFSIIGHRLFIAFLYWVAIVSVFLSPLFSNLKSRILGTAVSAFGLITYLPEIFGHMYKYQVIAGTILVISLSQYILVAILRPKYLNKARVVCGAFLLASMPFLSFTYLPTSILLLIITIRKHTIGQIAVGIALGIAAQLAFLGIFGSIDGYLAYHLYLNSKILPQFAGSTNVFQLAEIAFRSLVHNNFRPFFLGAIIFFIYRQLSTEDSSLKWRSLGLIAALVGLLIRGNGFHSIPFYAACFSIAAFAFETQWASSKIRIGFYYTALVLLTLNLIEVNYSHPKTKFEGRRLPEKTEFGDLAKRYTSESDRIIAYTFRNFEYLAAGRLPASSHFFYLPWQAKYNENPVFGVYTDPCKEIQVNLPKVMLVDKWLDWPGFSWASYGKCIDELLAAKYTQVGEKPYYIRADLLKAEGLESKEDNPGTK